MSIKEYNYNDIAKYYDYLELYDSKTNRKNNLFLLSILKKYGVKSILDFACGTGVQSIFLKKKGFNVTAVDLSSGLIDVAKNKAKNLDIAFFVGDMRSSNFGIFEGVIMMYNAIGHVTNDGLIKAFKNIYSQLNKGGIFVFDIFNFDFFKVFQGTDTSSEEHKTSDGTIVVRETTNTVDDKRECIRVVQKNIIMFVNGKKEVIDHVWDMNLFTYSQLSEALSISGFKVLDVFGSQDGDIFLKERSVSVCIVAQKV